MARLTPLLYQHMNMLGNDDLTLPEEVAQGQLRHLCHPNTLEVYLKQIKL